MHKWLIRILRYTDIRVLYVFVAVFVVPVCLALNPSCGITYRYFRQRHGYNPPRAAWQTYVNHCLFSQVVIDRFAMYAGKQFDIDIEGFDIFSRLCSEARGFLQLSAHIGNYEIAGYSLPTKAKRLNALVFAGEKASVMHNRAQLFAPTNLSMIAVRDDMGHVFEIISALDRGEIISMPADRLLGSEKKLTLDFLGAKADFPYGPFQLATARQTEVITVHVVKQASRRYKIRVAQLHYDKTAPRQQQILQLAQSYVQQLQAIVEEYPNQWYNYFRFWND